MADSALESPIRLLDRVARGDREAFGRFYDRYAGFVFSFALRILRNRTDAEDLTQDVFWQIWQNASRYDASRGAPEAWISNITRTRAIDRIRSFRSKERGRENLERLEPDRQAEREERTSDRADARFFAQEQLASLSEDDRKLLELVYFDGLTQTDIAERLDLPLGTVKTRIRAALQRLRQNVARQSAGGQAPRTETIR